MSKTTEHPLLSAARQLADDLSHFETLSTALSSLSINSEKSLQRARQGLEACSAHETKLAASLVGFASAMQTMQQIQQRCVELTAQATVRIAERQAQRAALQERLALLAESARAVSAPFADLTEPGAAGSGQSAAPLQEVERRLEGVLTEAAALCELAKQGEWSDLERVAQSLREQLQAVRNRVLLLRRKLASDAPS